MRKISLLYLNEDQIGIDQPDIGKSSPYSSKSQVKSSMSTLLNIESPEGSRSSTDKNERNEETKKGSSDILMGSQTENRRFNFLTRPNALFSQPQINSSDNLSNNSPSEVSSKLKDDLHKMNLLSPNIDIASNATGSPEKALSISNLSQLSNSTLFINKLKKVKKNQSYKFQRTHKKFTIFRLNEILLLRMDISPKSSKFKNFKMILNSVDMAHIFDFEDYLQLVYKEPMSKRLMLKIRRCNPKIHFLNFCHYIARKINFSPCT